jgi:plastocyanin
MKIAMILLMPTLALASSYVLAADPAPASPGEPSPEATISIREFMFAPMSLTVTAGTTVHWKNLDGEPHTVRGIDANFRSDPLDQNDTFAFKFDRPGTYRYVCSIHPQMLGTIVVKSATPPG